MDRYVIQIPYLIPPIPSPGISITSTTFANLNIKLYPHSLRTQGEDPCYSHGAADSRSPIGFAYTLNSFCVMWNTWSLAIMPFNWLHPAKKAKVRSSKPRRQNKVAIEVLTIASTHPLCLGGRPLLRTWRSRLQQRWTNIANAPQGLEYKGLPSVSSWAEIGSGSPEA